MNILKKWWFWAIVAVVGGIIIYFVAQSHKPDSSSSTAKTQPKTVVKQENVTDANGVVTAIRVTYNDGTQQDIAPEAAV